MLMLIFFLLATLIGVGSVLMAPTGQTWQTIAETLLLWQLVVAVGCMGIMAFVGHVFRGPKTAARIGWLPNNPFQEELGYCCLGMGLLGILSYWFRGELWLAAIVFTSTFLLGAALVHLREMWKHRNFNRDNALSVLPDVLIPACLISLNLLTT